MTTKTETLSPMQKELLERADAIFASMSDAVSKASGFVAEQVPEIALQYVAFGRAWLTTLIVFSILSFIVSAVLIRWVVKHSDDINPSPLPFVACAGIGGFSILGFGLLMDNIKNFLLVWFAPKVWLITSIVELVSSK